MKVLHQGRSNLVTTAAGFLLSMVFGIWFTPFLVHRLGPAGYGLIPLATTIVSYFSVISQTLSASLNRNLTFALESRESERVDVAFGSALVGSIVLAFILAVPLAGLAWFSTSIFHVPPGTEWQTRILFGFVGLAFIISVLSTPFQAISFSRNRLDLINISAIAQTLIRVGVTVGLFIWISATVVHAAFAILASAVAGVLLNMAFANIAAPQVGLFSMRLEREEFLSISGIASAGLIMQVGTVLTMSSELVLANLLFGDQLGGRYAAVMQWVLLLRNGAMAIAVLCVPTILTLYARNRRLELVSYTRTAMKMLAITVSLPAGYLCALSPQILGVWLGLDFIAFWPIMVLQITTLIVTATVLPLYTVSLAAKKIIVPGVVQLITGIFGVGLALVLGAHSSLGIFAIAATVSSTFAVKEMVFTIPYAATNIYQRRGIFYKPLLTSVMLFAVSGGTSLLIGHFVIFHSMADLLLAGIVITIPYFTAAFLSLDATERAMVLGFVALRSGQKPSA